MVPWSRLEALTEPIYLQKKKRSSADATLDDVVDSLHAAMIWLL